MKKNTAALLLVSFFQILAQASDMDCRFSVSTEGIQTDVSVQITAANGKFKANNEITSKGITTKSETEADLLEGMINPAMVSGSKESPQATELEKLFFYIESTRQMLLSSNLGSGESLASRQQLLDQFNLGFSTQDVKSAKAYRIEKTAILGSTYVVEPMGTDGKLLGRFLYGGFVTYKCAAEAKPNGL